MISKFTKARSVCRRNRASGYTCRRPSWKSTGLSRVLVSAPNRRMKLVLNSIFRLTDAQRRELAARVPGIDLVETNGAPDSLDPAGVDVLVSEQVPRNLEAWSRLSWVQLMSAGANQLLDHPIQRTSIPVTTA